MDIERQILPHSRVYRWKTLQNVNEALRLDVALSLYQFPLQIELKIHGGDTWDCTNNVCSSRSDGRHLLFHILTSSQCLSSKRLYRQSCEWRTTSRWAIFLKSIRTQSTQWITSRQNITIINHHLDMMENIITVSRRYCSSSVRCFFSNTKNVHSLISSNASRSHISTFRTELSLRAANFFYRFEFPLTGGSSYTRKFILLYLHVYH